MLPTATSSPAAPSLIPDATAVLTVYAPREAAAELPRPKLTAAKINVPERHVGLAFRRPRRDRPPDGRGIARSTTTLRTAAATYAQCQPTVSAIVGTDSPASSVPIGID